MVTREEWAAIKERYGGRCVRCGADGELTRDHVVPKVLGGLDVAANIQPLCRSCNSAKGARYADYREDAEEDPVAIILQHYLGTG
jgi:5-methylcytosine-specific restriction endonuclease McrA